MCIFLYRYTPTTPTLFWSLGFPSHIGFPLLSPRLSSRWVYDHEPRTYSHVVFVSLSMFARFVPAWFHRVLLAIPRIRPLLAHHPPLHRRPRHHITASASTTHRPLHHHPAYPTLPYRPA
ncbi:hypothetical protein VTO73DRAFT_5605 [Trametes versicolor]